MNEVNCSESDAAKRSVFDQVVMPHDAVMLRPVRFVGENDIKLYDPVEFKSGKEGCELYFRRCKVFGGIATSKEETVGLCDILNKDFDVVGDFPLTSKGLRWLYKSLDTRVAA